MLVIINLITLCYYRSRIKDLDVKTEETIAEQIFTCFTVYHGDFMVAVILLAPSFGSVFLIIVANVLTSTLSYILVWEELIEKYDKQSMVDQMLQLSSAFVMMGFMFFLLLQKRELS